MAIWGTDDEGKFGFGSVQDWFLSVLTSFPSPWSIKPLAGKYYGTVLSDARGRSVLSVWAAEGDPSHREKERFGKDWTPEKWAEYCCDTHWESAYCLAMAERIVYLRHRLDTYIDEDQERELLNRVLFEARWDDEVWEEVSCGGPQKRRLTSPSTGRLLVRRS